MGAPALTTPSVSYRLTHLALYAHQKNHRTVTSPWLRPSGTTMCRGGDHVIRQNLPEAQDPVSRGPASPCRLQQGLKQPTRPAPRHWPYTGHAREAEDAPGTPDRQTEAGEEERLARITHHRWELSTTSWHPLAQALASAETGSKRAQPRRLEGDGGSAPTSGGKGADPGPPAPRQTG